MQADERSKVQPSPDDSVLDDRAAVVSTPSTASDARSGATVSDPRDGDAGRRTREEPSLVGCIEVMRPDRIAGWVMDRSDPTEAVRVRCSFDGQEIADGLAERVRKDLEKAAIGTGRHGFDLALNPPLPPADLARCVVRAIASDGTTTVLLPRQAEPRVPTGPNELAALRSELAGMQRSLEVLAETQASAAASYSARLEAADAILSRVEMAALRLERADERLRERVTAPAGLRLVIGVLGLIAAAAVAAGATAVLSGS